MAIKLRMEEVVNGGYLVSELLTPLFATDDLEKALSFFGEKFGLKRDGDVLRVKVDSGTLNVGDTITGGPFTGESKIVSVTDASGTVMSYERARRQVFREIKNYLLDARSHPPRWDSNTVEDIHKWLSGLEHYKAMPSSVPVEPIPVPAQEPAPEQPPESPPTTWF